jgi:hypothetical protein
MKESTDLELPRTKMFAKPPMKRHRYTIERIETDENEDETRTVVLDDDGNAFNFPLMSLAIAERLRIVKRVIKTSNVRYAVKDNS